MVYCFSGLRSIFSLYKILYLTLILTNQIKTEKRLYQLIRPEQKKTAAFFDQQQSFMENVMSEIACNQRKTCWPLAV